MTSATAASAPNAPDRPGPGHHAAARDHCLAPSRAAGATSTYAGQYGRIFPDLEPLDCTEDLIYALGRAGGMLDARTSVHVVGDTAHGAAGWPLFGQFIAHDITADRSPLGKRADPGLIRNFRTPRANLECLYDAGSGTPFLYDRDDSARFLYGMNDIGAPDDLPRNSQGIALVGDPRNDVHLFISQLHLAFLRAHNGLVARLREDGVADDSVFDEARRATTWHYQWVILHDFLPRVVGADLMRDLLADGPRFYQPPAEPFIPFEFADAAYRCSHAQIRDTYVVRAGAEAVPIFPDLLRFRPVPAARVVDWSYLFDLPGRPARHHAKRIDGRLAHSLIDLPVQVVGAVEAQEYHSLAVRDLQRGQALGLPSGEAVARAIGVV